jgi:hypothetical protein
MPWRPSTSLGNDPDRPTFLAAVSKSQAPTRAAGHYVLARPTGGYGEWRTQTCAP